MKHPR